ncbi:MAG: hypothetical protein ACNA8R_04505 [Nitriliruptoraceae bacterium]
MTRTHSRTGTHQHRPTAQLPRLAAILGVVALAVVVAVSATSGAGTATVAATDPSLPNPMGGPALPAPGTVAGEVDLAGLVIADTEVAMGDIALGVTYVPAWEVTNPTTSELSFTAGQPQVLEGCCPGPVYVDGELTQAGQTLTVPAGGSVLVQFPLQMHPGMDGPHHLAIPLQVGSEQAALQVTGDFTASVTAG